jgi:hypothetical protein
MSSMPPVPLTPPDPTRIDGEPPPTLNRAARRALIRSLPRAKAGIARTMRGIKTNADAIALAKSRGL